LFGPAYKGITLAAAVSIELARLGHNKPFAYNRKEAKDHGEGGTLVGAPVQGRVLIIDDVISAGTSVRESIDMITQAGATPCGVAIALDRQEKATLNGADCAESAVQQVEQRYNLPMASFHPAVLAYRQQYGV
jgi:orotate phosphoribosyltransferase